MMPRPQPQDFSRFPVERSGRRHAGPQVSAGAVSPIRWRP